MAITSTSGTLSHGNSVTLAGSGFGTKSPAGPMVFDDFDDKSSGLINGQSVQIHQDNLSSYSTWIGGCNGGSCVTPSRNSTSPKNRSTHHVRANFNLGTGSGMWASYLKIPYDFFAAAGDKLYFSHYHRFTRTTGGFGRQHKSWMVFVDEDGFDRAYFNGSFNTCQSPDSWFTHRSEAGSGTPANENHLNIDATDLDGEWVRHDFYLKQSVVDVSNGSFHAAIGRPSIVTPVQPSVTLNNYLMKVNAPDWNDWRFGGAYYDECTSNSENATVDIDEFYIDKTPRRVELGNAATYSACTKREIQRATSWSDSSITIVQNHGYFSDGASAWYFVLDDDNVPLFSGNGFAVTLDGEGGGGGAPTVLRPTMAM